MSAKRSIFPPQNHDSRQPDRHEPEDFEDMYTGHPGDQPFFGQDAPRGAAKGRAAYAAHDKQETAPDVMDQMPSFEPQQRGRGLGGIFGGAMGQAEHEQPVEEQGDFLSVIPHDALERECQARICPSCSVKKDADDARLRALAELDNAKKRMEREHAEQIRFAAEAVLSDILPSLDNLDLALQHAGSNDACKDFVMGVRMTRKLLGDALAKHGLEQVGERGEEFNPALHEAVGMQADPEVADGHVCALLSAGYTLNGRLLRPARVMVKAKC